MPKISMDALRADLPAFSPDERARLDAMTDDDVEALALADADNSIATEEELRTAVFARAVRRTRAKLELSQERFAELFHVAVDRLRQWEDGRAESVDSVAEAYLAVIEREPDLVMRTVAGVK